LFATDQAGNKTAEVNSMSLAIVECRACGAAFWTAAEHQGKPVSGAIDGGPCCFGHPVLDIERFPTEKAAARAYDEWREAELAVMRNIWKKYSKPDVLA